MTSGADAGTHPSYKWLVLVVASAGLFLSFLDIAVNVALPDITRSFGSDIQTIQWIIIIYVGSSTGLQLSLGSAADTYGLKRVFVIGALIYTLAVLVIGLAPNLSVVFGLRVLQAIGNGLIAASVPALITRAFPAPQRGRALGLMAGLATAGMVAGSLGSGLLVDAFGWRSIFLARVPIGVVIALLALLLLREASREGRGASFDFSGGLTLLVGLTSFIVFLALGGRNGWTAIPVLVLASVSVVSMGVFVRVEHLADHPLIDIALLRRRLISFGSATAYLMYLAIFLNWFILPYYVTSSLGANAKALGVVLALTPIAGAIAAPLGGWLSDRISPAYVTTLALIILSGALAWFSSLDAGSTLADVGVRTGVTGLGIGLFQASNASLIMGSVPAHRLGAGGALIALARNLGTVSSVAILGALFAARLDWHAGSLAASGIAAEVAEGQAFIKAFRDTYLVSAALAAAGALVSLAYWPRPFSGR